MVWNTGDLHQRDRIEPADAQIEQRAGEAENHQIDEHFHALHQARRNRVDQHRDGHRGTGFQGQRHADHGKPHHAMNGKFVHPVDGGAECPADGVGDDHHGQCERKRAESGALDTLDAIAQAMSPFTV